MTTTNTARPAARPTIATMRDVLRTLQRLESSALAEATRMGAAGNLAGELESQSQAGLCASMQVDVLRTTDARLGPQRRYYDARKRSAEIKELLARRDGALATLIDAINQVVAANGANTESSLVYAIDVAYMQATAAGSLLPPKQRG